MAVSLVSANSVGTGASINNTLTLSSIAVQTGDLLQVAVIFRDAGAAISSMTFNGSSMGAAILSDGIQTAASDLEVAIYEVVCGSSGTFDAVLNLDNFRAVVMGYALFRGQDSGTPRSTLQPEVGWATEGYTNPTLTVASVGANDLVAEWLLATDWDEGYSGTGATWSPANLQTESYETSSTGHASTPRIIFASKTGSGSTVMGYTPSAGFPGYYHVAFRVIGPSSAPVLTSGTPTGTVASNPTVGCTTDTVANNIRFVIDTAANLDIVTEAQLILGQNETGSAAAYDSGAVAVTDTTPEFAFTGLANGTWAVRAIQYGGGNSNVLAWNITVAAEVALAGSAAAESAATGALSIPRLVIADLYRPNAPDTLVADATGATVVLYDVCGGTEQAQGVADIVSGDIDCSFAGMGNVGDSRFVVLRWTVGADEYTYAATHTLAGA